MQKWATEQPSSPSHPPPPSLPSTRVSVSPRKTVPCLLGLTAFLTPVSLFHLPVQTLTSASEMSTTASRARSASTHWAPSPANARTVTARLAPSASVSREKRFNDLNDLQAWCEAPHMSRLTSYAVKIDYYLDLIHQSLKNSLMDM